ncbi:unnamed protein product [Cuscuta epithymum]|uniref:CCHC-type domain-containing protein n=1 Tax=Cuscuta epithymum TaxID=186058 RepID=A0AAV0EUP6_9ASTE|nr:unnamed protein product [Cuscuta epithymum]
MALRIFIFQNIILSQDSQMEALALGNENRPPILRRGEYQMWKTRFLNFLKGKDNSSAMLESLTDGPAQIWMDVTSDGVNNPPATVERRLKAKSEYTEADRLRVKADLMAKTYLLQAIPNDIYILIDSMETAKEMWDEIKKLMIGTELGLKTKKANILTAYDGFKALPGEALHETYNRFVQLINEMRKIKVVKSNMEMNIRFLSSLPPEWRRTVKNLRQHLDLDELDLCTVHEHLQQFVNDTADMEGTYPGNPLALMMEAQPKSSSKAQKKKKTVVVMSEEEDSEEEVDVESELAELQKKMALLTNQFNKRFSKKGSSSNKLRTSSVNYKSKNNDQNFSSRAVAAEDPPKCFNCGKVGHVIKDCRLPRKRDFNYYKQKMLWNKQKMFMAKQDDDSAAMLTEGDPWQEESSDDEEGENLALMAIVEKEEEEKGDAAIPSGSSSSNHTDGHVWHLDSGCSTHLTGIKELLSNYTKCYRGNVRFGNNAASPIL